MHNPIVTPENSHDKRGFRDWCLVFLLRAEVLPLWRKFPFERKFLQNEGNLKEINFEGNVKEILEEQRKFEGKSKISQKLVIFYIFNWIELKVEIVIII
jgi:hypothetical protein